VIIAVLAGVLAGVATSFVVSHIILAARTAAPGPAGGQDRERTAEPPGAPAASPSSAVGGGRGDDGRLALLERRLAEVERRRLAATAPGAPAPPAESSPRRYEEQLRAHGNEPTDPRWAAPTAAAIESDLQVLARKASFKVTGVDCRSQLCTAELEWPSLAVAAEEQATLAHHPYRANCSRTLVLPEAPSDGEGSGPVKARLLFECASWRSAGSQPLELGRAGGAAGH
jgi:hypothetical protein